MGRLAAGAAAAALLRVFWLAADAGAQQKPGAPTITSVTAGDGSLTLVWTAPANNGGSAITAYNLRCVDKSAKSSGTPRKGLPIVSVSAGDAALTVSWAEPAGIDIDDVFGYQLSWIASNASDKSPARWNKRDVWDTDSGGPLVYVLTGLTNDTGYDVRVKTRVNSRRGTSVQSVTATGTPAEPGAATSGAVSLASGTPLGGVIQNAADADYFKITLTGSADLLVHTSGSLDTVGQLLSIVNNEQTISLPTTTAAAGSPTARRTSSSPQR